MVFSTRLVDWAKPYLPISYKSDENFARLLGVNVPDANVEMNDVTSSRANPKIAIVSSEMLHAIYKEAPYTTSTVTIITPYNAQRAVYLGLIRSLREKTKLPLSKLPQVATVNSMQGHDSDIVILDWVNIYGEDLGFLKDDRRANVALSRARACLIIFFSVSQIVEEPEVDKRKKGKGKEKPEVLTHWDFLVARSLVMQVKDAKATDLFLNKL